MPGQALIEALPVAAAIVDAGGVITAANRKFLASTATRPGESYLHFCERVSGNRPQIGAELSAGVRAVLAGRTRSFECDVPAGPGDPGVPMRVSAITFPVGPATRALLLYRDAASAGEIAPEQLRQSRKMETVGRLVGGVAHDFANLLTLVAGYTELLLSRTPANDSARAELEEIRKATSRGSRLTAQLLGYTRAQPAAPEAIDLNSVILELERLLRPIIGEYVRLETSLAPDLGPIVADRVEIEQVVMNLVLNARDAISTNGRILIATGRRTVGEFEARSRGLTPGNYVECTVSDNGHGMAADTLGRVFEPFFTTKKEGKGTGIGLSTVQRIVREYHGEVWARSRPGEGATFTVWLPSASVDVPAPAPAVQTGVAGSSGHECILLVEDEENVRRLLTHILERRGYRVLSAANAEEALRVFENDGDAIDLLLTDMVMPGMSGRELGDRVTAMCPDLPVIYMSGYTDDVLVRTGALKPGMSFLPKPLRPDVLAAKVREALGAPGQRKRAAG